MSTVPIEVDVPVRDVPGAPVEAVVRPSIVGAVADPTIADILAQTGGSPLWLLAALAAAAVVVGAALIARRRATAR